MNSKDSLIPNEPIQREPTSFQRRYKGCWMGGRRTRLR